jgi:hypothetical protein
MKANDFKKILKPLIKQTIREVLLEEGMLSKVVSEVAAGLNNTLVENQQTIRQSPVRTEDSTQKEKLYEKQRQERIKRLNESSNLKLNVFDDVTVVSESDTKSPLSGVNSNDAGVDISEIQKLSNGKWKTLAGGK